jgi:putative endonuclease
MGLVQFIAARFSRFGKCSSPSTDSEENLARRLGREGERMAIGFLRKAGCRILYRNFRAPGGGEIDIVGREKASNTLVFIEVKTRRSADFARPADAVGPEKQQLICRGARAWLRMLGNPLDLHYRFDIVEIIAGEGKAPEFNWIKDAFPMPEPFRD